MSKKHNSLPSTQDSLFDIPASEPGETRHPEEPQFVTGRPAHIPEAPEPYEGPVPSQMDIDDIRAEMDEDVDRLANLGGFTYKIAKDKEVGPIDKPDGAVPADESGNTRESDKQVPQQRGDRPVNRSGLSARDKRIADGPPDHIRKQNRKRGIY